MALVKIGISSIWVSVYNEDNLKKQLLELDLVEESRDGTTIWLKVYKQWMC